MAVRHAAERTLDQLGGQAPDLAVVFVSQQHQEHFDEVAALLAQLLSCKVLIGCSAGNVIGDGREVEDRPGLSLTAALLPDVALHAFHLDKESLPPSAIEADAWRQLIGLPSESQPDFLLLPDPFSFPTDTLLNALDRQFPASRKIGGLASGGNAAGNNVLYLGERAYRSGMVGLALTGNIETDTLVAQGCRPIGEPLFVTGAQRNVLRALDGQPPLAIINDLYGKLDGRDQELLRHSLFVGIAMQDARQEYRQGDFLIRNIIGLDQDSGAVAIGAVPQENSIVQFHLRDARTSAEDLEALLSRFDHLPPSARPLGSLLFSCLGRGSALYGQPNHDTHAFLRHVGDIPLGGFFCNGEIGPVQGATFLHGYTSAFALFKPRVMG